MTYILYSVTYGATRPLLCARDRVQPPLHKSYGMVLESWESIQGNLNAPLFVRGTFCERLRTACTKPIATELMDVSGLYNLNEQKVEELLCLLVFVWSPRSEEWPR